MLLGCVVKDLAEAEYVSKFELDYLELKGDMVFTDSESMRIVREKLETLKLPILAITSPLPRQLNCRIVGPDADLEKALTVFSKICQNASRLGVSTVVFGSGQARFIPDGFPKDRATEQLRVFIIEAAAVCNQLTMKIAIEPLNQTETNMLNSCKETRAFIDMLDLFNVTVLLDYYHVIFEGLSLDEEICAVQGKLGHVHTSAKQRNCKRVDKVSQASFFSKLIDIGYDETVSIECDFVDFFADVENVIKSFRQILSQSLKHQEKSER